MLAFELVDVQAVVRGERTMRPAQRDHRADEHSVEAVLAQSLRRLVVDSRYQP